MSDIIKEIESAQLKAEAPQFNVGDTEYQLRLRKATERESRYSRVLFLRDRERAFVRHSQ